MTAAAISALVAAAAFVLACRSLGALRRGLEEYQRRYVAPALRDLGGMFLFLAPGQLLALNLAALVLLAAFGWWAAGPLLAAILAVGGFFLPTGLVRAVRQRRRRRFDAQLTGALQQLSNCLRAGLTLQQGIDQVGRESRPPLQQEFGLFGKEVKLGVAPEEALAAIAHRVGSEDMELVATSANIARQMGGNMAEMLETIAATIRERFRLEGRIDALTSQGKLQGAIVSALPPCIGLGFAWLRPDLVAPMFEGAFGYGVIAAVALLEAIGCLLIRRIVGIDV